MWNSNILVFMEKSSSEINICNKQFWWVIKFFEMKWLCLSCCAMTLCWQKNVISVIFLKKKHASLKSILQCDKNLMDAGDHLFHEIWKNLFWQTKWRSCKSSFSHFSSLIIFILKHAWEIVRFFLKKNTFLSLKFKIGFFPPSNSDCCWHRIQFNLSGLGLQLSIQKDTFQSLYHTSWVQSMSNKRKGWGCCKKQRVIWC